MATAAYRGSTADLRDLLRQVPRVVAGLAADPGGVARAVQLRVGVAALSQVQQAFIEKSRGGVGSDGVQWDRLARSTVAARRSSRAELKALGVGGKRVRGLLTPAEDKLWRQLFARSVARFRLRMGEAEARAAAAKVAWAELKRRGAKTRLSVLGGRAVDIGRDTGRLFRSLTPGVDDRPSGAAEQAFDADTPGRVVVGSNVPYFPAFHRRRPVWPLDGSVPPAWWPAIRRAAARGLAAAVVTLVRTRGNL